MDLRTPQGRQHPPPRHPLAPPVPQADESLAELLLSASRGLRGCWAHAHPGGMPPHQVRALRRLGDSGPSRLGVLADALRIAPRSATDVVDALESEGYVERLADPADRRATVVALTARGSRALEVIAARHDEVAEDYFAALSERDRTDLARLLRKLPRRGRGS